VPAVDVMLWVIVEMLFRFHGESLYKVSLHSRTESDVFTMIAMVLRGSVTFFGARCVLRTDPERYS
jgi:hypothetical protein